MELHISTPNLQLSMEVVDGLRGSDVRSDVLLCTLAHVCGAIDALQPPSASMHFCK